MMQTVRSSYRSLCRFVRNPAVAWPLISFNVFAAIIGGVYWYGSDLLRTPWWALIFVPDCPLFTLFFAIALAGIVLGRNWNLFNVLTAVGMVKYGIWTVTVWALFWSAGYMPTPESIIMTLAHIGMILEGVVLAGFVVNVRWRHVLAVGVWFSLSDYVDYGLGFRPRMAPGVSESVMMWEMILATAVATAYYGWRAWTRGKQSQIPCERALAS